MLEGGFRGGVPVFNFDGLVDRDRLWPWPVGGFGAADDDAASFRAACFCCATTIGDRISRICLSMKTGFFLASLSFWKSSKGFSS